MLNSLLINLNLVWSIIDHLLVSIHFNLIYWTLIIEKKFKVNKLIYESSSSQTLINLQHLLSHNKETSDLIWSIRNATKSTLDNFFQNIWLSLLLPKISMVSKRWKQINFMHLLIWLATLLIKIDCDLLTQLFDWIKIFFFFKRIWRYVH